MMRHDIRLMGALSIVLLLTRVVAAWADEVPILDVNPICGGIAQGATGAGERGGPALSFARCVKSEQAIKKGLVAHYGFLIF
jgi:hypothetical protein